MDYGFVSCIPILVLITGALLTKKIGESMIAASVVGVAIVYKGGFFDGYVDTMYEVLTNESYQFIAFWCRFPAGRHLRSELHRNLMFHFLIT